MEDLFYYTQVVIRLEDIATLVQTNGYDCYFVDSLKPPRTLVVETGTMNYYCRWWDVDRTEFYSADDQKFLDEFKPAAEFLITYSPATLPYLKPIFKIILERYGGLIENPNKRESPRYDLETLDDFTY